MKFINPRREAVIENWPSGRNRVTATFKVEANKKGERVVRITTGKPHASIYHDRMVIVDGDDGKTYLLGIGQGCIKILPGTMKGIGTEYIWHTDPRFEELKALIETPDNVAA